MLSSISQKSGKKISNYVVLFTREIRKTKVNKCMLLCLKNGEKDQKMKKKKNGTKEHPKNYLLIFVFLVSEVLWDCLRPVPAEEDRIFDFFFICDGKCLWMKMK